MKFEFSQIFLNDSQTNLLNKFLFDQKINNK